MYPTHRGFYYCHTLAKRGMNVGGDLRCKVANLRNCILWLLEVMSCIIPFASPWPVPHLTVMLFGVINPVTICHYSCFHIIISRT